jgi:hypothetical protein
VILAVALLAVVVAVPALLLSGSSTAPTPSELREIRSTIQRWEAVEFLPWPRAYYSHDRLPQGVHKRMAAEKLAVAESVGTGEFAASYDVTRDQADTLEQFRKSGEPLVVKSPARVMEVSYERTELDGDVVVRVVVWRGEVTARWDKEQERLTDYYRIDGTPVYEYKVRRDGEGWRLVSRRQVELSADGSGEQFGPNTPHDQQPIHSEP